MVHISSILEENFSDTSFPRAIIHIDGDSFFASCEVAKNPSLRGKPVITGLEKGIASSMSYEAKARGVTRAMRLSEIRKLCPDAVILSSDYQMYELISRRMYAIARRYTPLVEEYSIDECFCDVTGLEKTNGLSYAQMAERIKHDLERELGVSFSVGLSVNKMLAKVASKYQKPSGLTNIPKEKINEYLKDVPIEKVWGVGWRTREYMKSNGVRTALDFAQQSREWIEARFDKPFREMHGELNGMFIHRIHPPDSLEHQSSIGKTRTFTPPSRDREFVLSELSKNIENAFIKLRHLGLKTKHAHVFLKNQDFKYASMDLEIERAAGTPEDIITALRDKFDTLFREGTEYRATGVTLYRLIESSSVTLDLFGGASLDVKKEEVHQAIDKISNKYGKRTVFLASSLRALASKINLRERKNFKRSTIHLLRGESWKRRINIPVLGFVR